MEQPTTSSKSSKPLTERYRPETLPEVIGQEREVRQLQAYVEDYHNGNPTMPHLLLSGPPGVGKSSAAFALARDLFGEQWDSFVLDLNASDDRGIELIRGRVKDFAKSTPMGEEFNIIVLDEADNLTQAAQAALRRTMEDYADSCRFILICNYPNRIIEPVRDRCSQFTFSPIGTDRGVKALSCICENEGMDASQEALEALWEDCRGSMRAALNRLQGLPSDFSRSDIQAESARQGAEEVLASLAQGDTQAAEKRLLELIRSGTSADEVFLHLFEAIEDSNMPEAGKDKVLFQLGEVEYRVQTGCSLEVQARCFLRWLNKVRKDG